MFKLKLLTLSVALALGLASAAHSTTFRWSSASDIPTWDIHAQNNALGNGVHASVYESLVYYNSRTFRIEPKLATAWTQVSPNQLRLTLRQGVQFHDGTPFTAEDAVFSLQRAMAPTSNFSIFTQGIERVVRVDARTIDIFTRGPNPVLLNQLTELRIMSRAWAERNRSLEPMNIRTREENFAHRNAMGTGPFRLRSWQPDQRMVLERNPNHWGGVTSNVTEIIYTPISSDATRMAALLSGEVDFVLDPTPQDLPRVRANTALRVLDGVENRTIFLGMDQHRDELVGSNVRGANPLKDVRVRRALYQAIDINAIHRVTMRGLSQNTGALVAPMVSGWSEAVHQRLPFDQAAARRLLAEAGYPNGFEVDFACPNNRYINDEQICQAITAMWARIGVQARLRTLPLTTYFPMIQRFEASIYMLGWGVPTFDALYSLQSLARTVGPGGDGNFNAGRFSSPRLDALIDRIKTETDPHIRPRLLTQALQLHNEYVAHIPLHNQVIPWAMRANVQIVHRPDNRIDWRILTVGN
ncbi:ABC transporter substrate-binding protein [Serpentinimonas barnesii]|uniref:ABC transporter substrate-binding protein n=1 Tax=Serpentinimonas barnesii TaxID=1458427 RepID=UPI0004975097|nr:ABC transporter substrate-binding protein [Serpentinimonas barnesii]